MMVPVEETGDTVTGAAVSLMAKLREKVLYKGSGVPYVDVQIFGREASLSFRLHFSESNGGAPP